jgi:tryptophan-rich sensory protein
MDTIADRIAAHVPAAPRRSPWLGLLGWIALVALAAVAGSLGSTASAEFYRSLDLPAWAPPSSVFGPVWTTLYLAMAVAAWLVWKARGWDGARGALALFCIQLVFNALWSWLFFAWKLGALAFADIVLLIVLVAATTVSFFRIHRGAGALMLPYVAWTSFAAALNYAIWQRNAAVLG